MTNYLRNSCPVLYVAAVLTCAISGTVNFLAGGVGCREIRDACMHLNHLNSQRLLLRWPEDFPAIKFCPLGGITVGFLPEGKLSALSADSLRMTIVTSVYD